ncbi:PQQ-dependent sugar dehydrogenase [Neotabrizicola shimadae]|uniref:PQQ-dependent sugar dehydrogenase n=1 Tax=Neotabrizicola shimadae TaxID=2807096 RepID=A0A8G0ZWT7_9RHOB|nr:PQQ-dependent sugar dehydrogenase [Neotabrizicola shimadae]QYZ71597.1 PQQ-dependent sugar dehydrogenase [Neotabrizicola shimadae]
MKPAPILALAALLASPAAAEGIIPSSAGSLAVTPVLTGLNEPWGMAFLPDGSVLVTERDGRLLLSRDGAAAEVGGLPEVFAEGQGGLLDVLVPRDFADSRRVWLSFANPVEGGAATATGFGRLSDDGTRIEGFRTVFTGDPMPGGRHFGARLVEMPDGTVALTTGDRGTGPMGLQAQDPQRAEGKVILLTGEGAPAVTRPDARPGVFSLGHRNIQGATLDLQGQLWVVEHGARGGDELNRIEEGRNYGWPVISYGVNYNGDTIGNGSAQDGMEQPVHYWDPSIAPSGLLVYSGKLIPGWKGDILFGSLNSDFLGRLDPDTPAATGFAEERLSSDETQRVRDVTEAPDGSIWFLSVGQGALYRLAPGTSG